MISGSLAPAQNPSPSPKAAGYSSQEPDGAVVWQALSSEPLQPIQPPEWKQNPPSEETYRAWIKQQCIRLATAADRARDFYLKYPNDAYAAAAKEREWQALTLLSKASPEAQIAQRIDDIEKGLLNNSSLSAQQRYGIRAAQVQRKAHSREEYEKGIRDLLREFPDDTRSYQLLLSAQRGVTNEHAREVAQEVLGSNAPDEIKAEAKSILNMMDSIGKPLNLQYTALDGRKIDLQKMKGKVVLIDFWATWCAPCVADMPAVKEIYDKLHLKGFEILGVNFDQEKPVVEQFLKEKQLTWPQYYDGKGWRNKFGQEFGIDTLPRMWLVDKKGVLRDLDGRKDLESKVENLLAEP